MQYLVDYLSFSDREENFDYWVSYFHLPLNECEIGHSRYGWSQHLYLGGMHVYFGLRKDICFEFSGQGCRFLETLNDCKFDWESLLLYFADHHESSLHVSRLDIACDDKDGVLNFEELYNYTSKRCYVSRAKRVFWSDGSEQQVVFGSPSSDCRLRIYNKALERGCPDDDWIRAEFQFRDNSALSFLLNFKFCQNIGQCYSGVLLNYLRYTVHQVDGSHYGRVDTADFWERFINGASKLKNIYVCGLEYNKQSLNDFIRKQCASSLKLWLELNGGDLTELAHIVNNSNLNQKQRDLLRRETLREGSGYNDFISK